MCGVTGFTGTNNRPLLRRMTESLRHRGPDGDGFYADEQVNLGMRRLAPEDIIDRPKEGFVQPNDVWMHDSLKGWTLECLGFLPRGLFNSRYLDTLISRFESGDQSLNAKIGSLTCFSLWWQQRN